MDKKLSSAVSETVFTPVSAFEVMLACVSIAPLALPVVPEVYIKMAREDESTSALGSGVLPKMMASRK